MVSFRAAREVCQAPTSGFHIIVAIFYPFSQFCEIDVSIPSLQNQPKTAPNLFQRGVEYGEYAYVARQRRQK